MEHTKFVEQISLWLDDNLEPTEITELQAHLAQCTACNETYQAVRQADHLLRTAATVMAEPAPGFRTRFETRLAYHKPRRAWHVGLGVSILLLGGFVLLAAGVVAGSLTLLSAWANLIETQLVYSLLGEVGQMVNQARVVINLGELLFRIAFRTMSYPIFWISIPFAIGLSWLWVRMMRTPYQPLPTMADMLV